MQRDNMKLHAQWSNNSTHTHETSLKDKLSKTATRHIASTKTHATVVQYENKRHGHDVQVMHYKT